MFKKLFDVADLTLHMKGKGVGVGSMVTSINTAQDTSDETPLGMTLGLADGVVEGVSASMLFNSYAASAAVAEDFDTIGIEADAAVAHVFGLALSGGYTLPGEDLALSGNLTVGIKDLDDLANAYVVGLTVDFGMPSMFDLAVGFEFNYLAGNGMGAGVNVGAEIMGIAPSVTFLYKNAAFGGDDTYTTSYDIDYPVTDDVDTESGMQAEFDAIDSADAMALSIGLSVSTEKLMDLKLATLSGGYDMMLAGGTESGYNAALGIDFTDIAEVPVTLDASISNWAELGLNYGVSLGYTYEMVGITASYDVNEVDGETTYSVLAKISF